MMTQRISHVTIDLRQKNKAKELEEVRSLSQSAHKAALFAYDEREVVHSGV